MIDRDRLALRAARRAIRRSHQVAYEDDLNSLELRGMELLESTHEVVVARGQRTDPPYRVRRNWRFRA